MGFCSSAFFRCPAIVDCNEGECNFCPSRKNKRREIPDENFALMPAGVRSGSEEELDHFPDKMQNLSNRLNSIDHRLDTFIGRNNNYNAKDGQQPSVVQILDYLDTLSKNQQKILERLRDIEEVPSNNSIRGRSINNDNFS